MSSRATTDPTASTKPLRAIFVSWGKLRRADTIARHIGIPSYTIRYFYRGYRGNSPPVTVLKYLLQSAHTFFLCVFRLPRVVFVTNPPLFAIFPVYLYALVFRARYVMDFHSGCFIQEHWRRWDRWQRFFARRAAVNLVHNADNAHVLEAWGAPHEVLPSLPPELEPSGPPPGRARPRCVYICSFKEDEPVEKLLEAAGKVPRADFFVTGRAPEDLRSRLPPNVHLTGFLGEGEYNALLADADLILALTTRSGTLVYGAQEAIALHKPLVLSRTDTLRAYFAGGAVFADNTPEGLRSGIEDALSRRHELVAEMACFHERYMAQGSARIAKLLSRLG